MGRKVWLAVVSGPLAPFAAGFEGWLRSRGYSRSAAANRLCQLDQLSRWLGCEGLGVGELTGERVERFVDSRRARGLVTWVSSQSLALPLEYLRELGVVVAPAPPLAQRPFEELLPRIPPLSAGRAAALGAHGGRCVGAGRAGCSVRAGSALTGWAWSGLSAAGCEHVSGARVPEAQRVGSAGSGVRAAPNQVVR